MIVNWHWLILHFLSVSISLGHVPWLWPALIYRRVSEATLDWSAQPAQTQINRIWTGTHQTTAWGPSPKTCGPGPTLRSENSRRSSGRCPGWESRLQAAGPLQAQMSECELSSAGLDWTQASERSSCSRRRVLGVLHVWFRRSRGSLGEVTRALIILKEIAAPEMNMKIPSVYDIYHKTGIISLSFWQKIGSERTFLMSSSSVLWMGAGPGCSGALTAKKIKRNSTEPEHVLRCVSWKTHSLWSLIQNHLTVYNTQMLTGLRRVICLLMFHARSLPCRATGDSLSADCPPLGYWLSSSLRLHPTVVSTRRRGDKG